MKITPILKQLFIPLVLLFITVPGSAQLAPDFTITDSDGITRSLYADHLNNGQTVVIKIFFTTCPPCNSIAADFQDLYEDWGEGAFDVEFMELSNKTFDSNQDVEIYQLGKGLTFIGAGNDGGSIAAVNLFTDGTYGVFTGTPTFIVIAPDGTVNFGVSGPGNAGKIAAINDAIIATGATGPDQTPDYTSFQVSIKDIYGSDLDNAILWLRSEDNPQTNYNLTELTSGSLIFDYPSDMLPDMPSPEMLVSTTTESAQNLSGSDLVVMQLHILGLNPIDNPLLVKAADINNNGSVSGSDLVQMINVILGLSSEFPNNEFWRYYFSACNDCETYPLPTAFGENLQIQVTGVRTGDVNY